jgi:hypothetical protein
LHNNNHETKYSYLTILQIRHVVKGIRQGATEAFKPLCLENNPFYEAEWRRRLCSQKERCFQILFEVVDEGKLNKFLIFLLFSCSWHGT